MPPAQLTTHSMLFLSGVLSLLFLFSVESVRFMLDTVNEHYTPRGRCVLYKIPGHSLVTGKVIGMPPNNGRIGVYAYDPQSNQPFSRPDLNGEVPFSFRSADVPTEYEICFRMNARSGYGAVPGNPIVPVEIQLSHTFDLFDDNKAHDLKVKPIESEFIRLEEVMRSVVQETTSLNKVQQTMRDVNESTFNSLKYLSILTFFAFVGLNAYQVFYMKKYFKSKKLI
jgi:p24 family protein delta-1